MAGGSLLQLGGPNMVEVAVATISHSSCTIPYHTKSRQIPVIIDVSDLCGDTCGPQTLWRLSSSLPGTHTPRFGGETIRHNSDHPFAGSIEIAVECHQQRRASVPEVVNAPRFLERLQKLLPCHFASWTRLCASHFLFNELEAETDPRSAAAECRYRSTRGPQATRNAWLLIDSPVLYRLRY
jgi:hypothetical protein